MRKPVPELQLNVRVPADVIDGLTSFCDNTTVKKKAAVELALRRFLQTEREKLSDRSSD